MNADYNRKAGRTTATLKNAIEVFLDGKNVAYFVPTAGFKKALLRLATDLLYARGATGYKVKQYEISGPNGIYLRFIDLKDDLRGRNEVTIPDHFAFEVLLEEHQELREKYRKLEAQVENSKRLYEAKIQRQEA